MSQFERLDSIVRCMKDGEELGDCGFGVLSTSQQLYVALAANNAELLRSLDYTICQAMSRLGDDWVRYLVARWG